MIKDCGDASKDHVVVSHEQWLSARTAFLAKEKEFTRLRDELGRQRRELPGERGDKSYGFEGASGKETPPPLFGKRNQLVGYHFMFPPSSGPGGQHFSVLADNLN